MINGVLYNGEMLDEFQLTNRPLTDTEFNPYKNQGDSIATFHLDYPSNRLKNWRGMIKE